MSKSGRFAPDFMIMQRRKEEEYRRTYDEKVKSDSTIGRVAHWEHKTSDKCGIRPPAPATAPALVPRVPAGLRAGQRGARASRLCACALLPAPAAAAPARRTAAAVGRIH